MGRTTRTSTQAHTHTKQKHKRGIPSKSRYKANEPEKNTQIVNWLTRLLDRGVLACASVEIKPKVRRRTNNRNNDRVGRGGKSTVEDEMNRAAVCFDGFFRVSYSSPMRGTLPWCGSKSKNGVKIESIPAREADWCLFLALSLSVSREFPCLVFCFFFVFARWFD